MTRDQHGKQPGSGKPSLRYVRSQIAALSRQIVAEDREALEILASYDRGEEAASSDQGRQAASSEPMQAPIAPNKR